MSECPETNDQCIKDQYQEDKNNWSNKANKYAKYALVCFRPEVHVWSKDDTPSEQDYTWNALCDWIQDMTRSKRLIDRLRLDSMFTYLYGHRTTENDRKLFTDYRMRNRTLWTQSEKDEIKACFPGQTYTTTETRNELNERTDDR